ncbi:MAG: hypothetical protein K1X74_05575 [Pirellulales bacterium]|nr:hypothetical protein [Pirellulales bacterium]
MRITHLETYPVRVPLRPERRMVSSLGRHEVSEYLLVRLIAAGDPIGGEVEGVGEATVMPRWSGETVASARYLVEQYFAPAVLGCDVRAIDEIARRLDAAAAHNWFTKAAVEMACWDAHGKAVGKPVYELLGGPCRERSFDCRFSVGAYDGERLSSVVAERLAAGFRTIKVKVGGTGPEDVARVRAARALMGPEPRLDIDANCGWDVETAKRKIAELGDCQLALVEQPTPDGDFAALAEVRRSTRVPIMADDICFDLADARELARNACCDVINVYPGKHGGLGRALEIVGFAASHGIACTIGSNLELDVATAAMAHLVVAHSNMQVERFPGDCLGPIYHEFSVVHEPVSIRGPSVTIADRPGLGVAVDWDLVRRHPAL